MVEARTEQFTKSRDDIGYLSVSQDKGKVTYVDNIVGFQKVFRRLCFHVPFYEGHICGEPFGGRCCIKRYIKTIQLGCRWQSFGQVSKPYAVTELALPLEILENLPSTRTNICHT